MLEPEEKPRTLHQATKSMTKGEIIVAPHHDSGHVFPATELARRLAARDYRITLLLPSAPSSSLHPLIRVVVAQSTPRLPPPPSSAPPGPPPFSANLSPFRKLLAEICKGSSRGALPVCAIVDVMMSQLLDVCNEFEVPAVAFFTSSACSAALEHAVSKISAEDVGPGGVAMVPGLPEEITLTAADLMHSGPPHPPFDNVSPPPLRPPPSFLPGSDVATPPPRFDDHQRHGGPPPPPGPTTSGWPLAPPLFEQGACGGPPPGPPQVLVETHGAVALLFNTCDDLERPFLHYIADEAKKPVWGVGPLLPSPFWSTAGSVLHDDTIRSRTDRGIDAAAVVTESDVLQFLDAKPRGSVIYVSFGSLVIPSDAELAELASALEESSRPFIWVLQPQAMKHDATGRPVEGGEGQGYFPEGLAERVGGRGLVIHGWAPQLLILSHPATGGFLTHCGWNSTVEALGLGVPLLAWPVHGDQVWNAKLVTRKLRTGLETKDGGSPEKAVTRAEVAEGIERLMTDEGTRKRAAALARELFEGGFPASSEAAFDALLEFVAGLAAKRERK